MTIKQAVKILELYNKWRRGADIKQQDPHKIGVAIDTAIKELSK